jgi:hypothetical protein
VKKGKGGRLASHRMSWPSKIIQKFSGMVARPKFKSKFGDFFP